MAKTIKLTERSPPNDSHSFKIYPTTNINETIALIHIQFGKPMHHFQMILTKKNGETVSVQALDYPNLKHPFNEFFVEFEPKPPSHLTGFIIGKTIKITKRRLPNDSHSFTIYPKTKINETIAFFRSEFSKSKGQYKMNLTLANGSTVSVEALDYSNLRDAFNEFFVDFELRVKERNDVRIVEILKGSLTSSLIANDTFIPYSIAGFDSESSSALLSEFTQKPSNVTLKAWYDFEKKFCFCTEKSYVIRASNPKLLFHSVHELDSVAAIKEFLSTVLQETIKPTFNNSISVDKCISIGRPSIHEDNQTIKLLIEPQHPENCSFSSHLKLIDTFNNQIVNDHDDLGDPAARPINQLVNYFLLNNTRHGILTNLRQSYAFERRENSEGGYTIRVAPMKEDQDFLKLAVFLLSRSESFSENKRSEQVTIPARESIKCRIVRDPEDTQHSLRPGVYESDGDHNRPELLSDRAITKLVFKRFSSWDFDIDHSKVLGEGSFGCVLSGQAWHTDNPTEIHPVAVKMADLEKMTELEKELIAETRFLLYSNQLGLKCVPKLVWAGFYGFGGQFYAICTEHIQGYSKNLKCLDAEESAKYQAALSELQSANIKHKDLRKANVIFTPTQCYIIDLEMEIFSGE